MNAGGKSNGAGMDMPVAGSTYSIEDMYWGYIIRKQKMAPLGVIAAQGFSLFLGVCFLVAAVTLYFIPTSLSGESLGIMRTGVSVIMGSIAVLLLFFASRGTITEVQIDSNLGEVREVVRNRAGRPSTIGTYGVETITGAFVETSEDEGRANLVLRHSGIGGSIAVAAGTEAQLLSLRDRLATDLMVEAATVPDAASLKAGINRAA